MKREILFKAKTENNKWIEGCYYNEIFRDGLNNDKILFEKHFIKKIDGCFDTVFKALSVVPDTVCQFTGLTDKNGVKIFEGDIVRHLFEKDEGVYNEIKEVYFDNEMLEFGLKMSNELFHCQFKDEFEVIGNIFDNHELLERQTISKIRDFTKYVIKTHPDPDSLLNLTVGECHNELCNIAEGFKTEHSEEIKDFLCDLYSNRDSYSGGGLIDEIKDKLKEFGIITDK